jgi:hypothetical protein
MKTKLLILSTLAYVFTIFPITAIWHVGIFNELYLGFGYFKEEETLLAALAGFSNIVVQGGVLAILFLNTKFSGSFIVQGLKFSGVVFVFYFSIQVVNFVVRKEVNNLPFFIALEITYMAIQFLVYGMLMGFLYSKFNKQ